MSLLRIESRTSALLVASQEIANFSDAVMAVLIHAVDSNATNVVCRIGRDLSIELIDNGDGVAHAALATLAKQSDAPSSSFSEARPIPLVHVIAAAQLSCLATFFLFLFFRARSTFFTAVLLNSHHASSMALLQC
jgi:hypothetical protein